jgi:hypothetical protein
MILLFCVERGPFDFFESLNTPIRLTLQKKRKPKWQHQEVLLRPISRKKNFTGRANVEKTSGVRSNGCRRTLVWATGGGHYASVAKKHA